MSLWFFSFRMGRRIWVDDGMGMLMFPPPLILNSPQPPPRPRPPRSKRFQGHLPFIPHPKLVQPLHPSSPTYHLPIILL